MNKFIGAFSIFVLTFLVMCSISFGQQVPYSPISYRIFTPFLFNPAIAGSKDFFSVDFIGSSLRNSNSQLLSGNTRLIKRVPGYFSSPDGFKFTKIGVGGYVFNDVNGPVRNLGAGIGASYHIPLNKKNLSFLSIGAAIKGVSFKRDSASASDPVPGKPPREAFYPNVDFGIYFYGPNLFAGVSATNLLGNPEKADTLGIFDIPVSRLYFLQAGYKILLSRSLNIVLEPSFILNSDGSSTQKIEDMIKPMMKLYLDKFCAGTYFNDFNHYSVFFQYKFPKLYLGVFFQLPQNSPYYKKELVTELTLGINLSRFSRYNHW